MNCVLLRRGNYTSSSWLAQSIHLLSSIGALDRRRYNPGDYGEGSGMTDGKNSWDSMMDSADGCFTICVWGAIVLGVVIWIWGKL